MVNFEFFQKLALSFPEVAETPHFEKTSFRVKNKIFATYDFEFNKACIKLSEIDQDVFSVAAKSIIYPVNNKWGKQGWTFVELDAIQNDLLVDVLTTAYCQVAPRKLAEQIRKRTEE